MAKIFYYDNLSQCRGDRMVYLRSTDVEQHNYHRLLWSVPDEWLYLLSIDQIIEVRDKSGNQGKIEHVFVPVLRDLLNALYCNLSPAAKHLREHYHWAWKALREDSSLLTKYKYWKNKIQSPTQIRGQTIKISRETNPLEKT